MNRGPHRTVWAVQLSTSSFVGTQARLRGSGRPAGGRAGRADGLPVGEGPRGAGTGACLHPDTGSGRNRATRAPQAPANPALTSYAGAGPLGPAPAGCRGTDLRPTERSSSGRLRPRTSVAFSVDAGFARLVSPEVRRDGRTYVRSGSVERPWPAGGRAWSGDGPHGEASRRPVGRGPSGT